MVKKAVAGEPIALPDGRAATISVSIGACLVEAGDSIDATVDMADAALYSAKAKGRDPGGGV